MSDINAVCTEEVYGEVLPRWWSIRVKDLKAPYKINRFKIREGTWGLT